VTEREAEIRRWVATGDIVDRHDAAYLLAIIDGLRALPVLRTCNDCASYRVTQGGVKGECGRTGEWLCDAEDGAPVPPARCPLRRSM
jgi:hypothetical protein